MTQRLFSGLLIAAVIAVMVMKSAAVAAAPVAEVQAQPALAEHPDVAGALSLADAWIEGLQAYDNIPGVSVGFVVDQELVFSKGYGYANVRRKRPADENTIYSICSISKLFTSIGVMQQRDAGSLALRDPVTKHLPWFNIDTRHAAEGPARIHGLLTHSSGLPREIDFPYWIESSFPFPDRPAMIERIAAQETLYPADTLFQYSNLGLTLAGEIVAAAAGERYEDYVVRHILEPLGMSDTRPSFPTELHGKQMAVGYTGQARDGKRKAVPPFDTRAVVPAAGFTSTVRDLAAFAAWQFRLLKNGGTEVLAANTLREMQRVHWVDEDWKSTWGLGFVVANADGTTMVGHGGTCPGYQTSILLVPKHNIAAIALTNASDGSAHNIARNMLQTIGSALKKAAGDDKASEPLHDLNAYAGNYAAGTWGGELAVRISGDKLAVLRLPQDKIDNVVKLKNVEGDTFVRITDAGDERETWVFQRDGEHVVTGVKRHSQTYPRLP